MWQRRVERRDRPAAGSGQDGGVTGVDQTTIIDRAGAWDAVVGQDEAVRQLKGAAAAPVHAYLLVGPAGSGKRAAATAFAAVLLACDAAGRGADAERALALALDESHPDLDVLRTRRRIAAGQRRRSHHQGGQPESGGGRPQGAGAHRVREGRPGRPGTAQDDRGAAGVDRVRDPGRGGPARAGAHRQPDGADRPRTGARGGPRRSPRRRRHRRDVARAAAAASGGDLRRARLLVGDASLGVRRDAWASIPTRVDGTGYTAAQLVDEVVAHIDAAQEPLDDRHATERDELEERIETYGQPKSLLKEQETRHKREVRRHRTAELRFGLATMAGMYRDRLVTATDPRPHLAALDAIQAAADAWVRNPNELLLLQALVSGLDPV